MYLGVVTFSCKSYSAYSVLMSPSRTKEACLLPHPHHEFQKQRVLWNRSHTQAPVKDGKTDTKFLMFPYFRSDRRCTLNSVVPPSDMHVDCLTGEWWSDVFSSPVSGECAGSRSRTDRCLNFSKRRQKH